MPDFTPVVIALIAAFAWGIFELFIYRALERRAEGMPGIPIIYQGGLLVALTGGFVAYVALVSLAADPPTWMVILAAVLGARLALSLSYAAGAATDAHVVVHGAVLDDIDQGIKDLSHRPPFVYPYEVNVRYGGNVTWHWNVPLEVEDEDENMVAVGFGVLRFNKSQKLTGRLRRWRPFRDRQGNPIAEDEIPLVERHGRMVGRQRLGRIRQFGRGNYELELRDRSHTPIVNADPGMRIPKG